MTNPIVFFDLEVSPVHHRIADIGAVSQDNKTFHSSSIPEFRKYLPASGFLCGHNILKHDLIYLGKADPDFQVSDYQIIDTLPLSPLLFPKNPYHKLVKNDKLQTEELNNPLNDAMAARELFYEELNAFHQLPEALKSIYSSLLSDQPEFAGLFKYLALDFNANELNLVRLIQSEFGSMLCSNASLAYFIERNPVSLAFSLSILSTRDRNSVTPAWVLINYPEVSHIMMSLRNIPCKEKCSYCAQSFNILKGLKRYFGYDGYRKFDGVALQEQAVASAVSNESLIAIFPTGGGKSLTFQVPALMAGEATKGLTVVISPLQSLMKDQVDNLEKRGITEAVTINGLLDPIERSKSFERVESGTASMLYISPESLRSKSIERLLLGRTLVRFVIDEAHCFSSWGHDFRVDYLYIGDFIRSIQEKKQLSNPIPVSCFTATARKKVIDDIRHYFREKLALELRLFKASAGRSNLHYKVFPGDDPDEKYNKVRELLEVHNCPAIIYVSRTRMTHELANKLNADGFKALPFHGKLESKEKTENQNAFISGETNIIVATSAFGMGVDKGDVGVVIHFEISNSLENYVQEAGRAGRDENLVADCYILFSEEDLNKHFLLHNQTKLSIKEIQQIWRAIKEFTKYKYSASQSALEIARKAGWDDQVPEIETRVTTAIAALEEAGYLERGQNIPRIYANSILTKNVDEAVRKINESQIFSSKQKIDAIRIIKRLFSAKSKSRESEDDAESRIDYMSDILGIVKEDVLRSVSLLREEGILDDHKDLTAFIQNNEGVNKSLKLLESYALLENYLLEIASEEEQHINLKEVNEAAKEAGVKAPSSKKIKTVLNFWAIKNIVKRKFHSHANHHISMMLNGNKDQIKDKQRKRHELSQIILEGLFTKIRNASDDTSPEVLVAFSVMEIKNQYEQGTDLFARSTTIEEVEDALFFLSKIGAIKIEGGFMIVYNRLTLNRLETNNKIQYKGDDYQNLEIHYENKVKQIHIVGEYAKKMIGDHDGALQFVDDYFQLNYDLFESRYFPGQAKKDLKRNMTNSKFEKLFGSLSDAQREIINDDQSHKSVVVAGPGSGKTRVLVHKLASILLMEDVKHEQLLMLTFSRAAATEFKKRLIELVGGIAFRIEIKTFYSYCFDLLDKRGTIEKLQNVMQDAIQSIRDKTVELSKVTKSILVIDEAQDMSQTEFELVESLMNLNEGMRIIAVGDDDQNIYSFRGSDNRFFRKFALGETSKQYELLTNYRSKKNLVAFNNQFLNGLRNRMKQAPLISNFVEDGQLKIVSYKSRHLIRPLVNELVETKEDNGTTAILTQTNEEVLKLAWLLKMRGINPKIVQSQENFNLYDLMELRTFLADLGDRSRSPVISKESWDNAKRMFAKRFENSSNYELCKHLLSSFQEINPKVKYWTDLEAYMKESRIEDFTFGSDSKIFVSTIHKAKGKEFDNVCLLLEDFRIDSDEQKRLLYVGMTRAKNNLTVHYNQQFLNKIIVGNMKLTIDDSIFKPLNHLSLQLGHRDVNLGYFKFVQHRVNQLISGDSLSIKKEGLANKRGELLLKYSESFQKRLAGLIEKGYYLEEARCNFIVYWKGKDAEDEEVKVLFPVLSIVKD